MQEKKQKNADFIHRIGPLNIKPTVYFAENEPPNNVAFETAQIFIFIIHKSKHRPKRA